jgi:hypothetical protein
MRVPKTLFAVIFVFFLTLPAVAQDNSSKSYSTVTNNPKIIQALDLMNGTTAEWAKKSILGDNASGLPMIIQFKDLSELSPDYANFDALGWKKGKQLYIFINKKHQGAPPEALASLLSHESVHQDSYCSLEEETYAWGYEADVWIQMVKKNSQAAQIQCPLTERLNTIARLFKNANYSTNSIRSVVYSNPGYKGLPVHSPGF